MLEVNRLMKRQSHDYWSLPLIGAVVCLALGIASGMSTVSGGGSWYESLKRPPGTPPSWVFGPVWSVLYVMMGVAAGRLLHRQQNRALGAFTIQFICNLLWTPVFFGLHLPGVALGVIGVMWFGILATIGLSWKPDRWAAVLLMPYLGWVSYATYLNAGFFWLNR